MSIDTQANSTPGPSTRRTSRSLRVQVSALILMVTVPLMAITYVVPLVFELRHAREHGGGVPHHGWATWATLGIELAVAGLIAAAVWYVTGRILAPVRSLTRAAERLGSGDWDVGDLPEPDNELGQLTRSFREMAEHLRGTVERTESHIAGRTAELNQAHRNERALRKSLDRERIRLEAVLATIPQGVFWTDLDSVILGCNQALADIYGIDRADDLVGRVDPDDNRAVGHPEAVQACLDDQRVINHGEAMLDYEETYTRADGRTFTLLTSKVPLRDPDGQIVGILGSTVDITAAKQRETQAAHARKMESIGELAAGIAHEINTPTQFVAENTRFLADAIEKLTGVIARCDQLAAPDAPARNWQDRVEALRSFKRAIDFDFVTAEAPLAVRESLEGIQRIAEIVQAMREFSHPGEAVAKSFDLNHIVRSSATVCRNRWKYVADLGFDLQDDLPTVHGHGGELSQVLVNLFINAADAVAQRFTPEANGLIRGLIRVATRHTDGHVLVEIADNGIGVPDDLRERIFDPFFTTKPPGEGTGQGLALAHKIVVKKHGGRIELVTTPGGGATFRLHLPDRPTAVRHASEPAAPSRAA